MIFTLAGILSRGYLAAILYIYLNTSHFSSLTGLNNLDINIRSDINSLGYVNLFWMWTNTYYLYTLLVAVSAYYFYFRVSQSLRLISITFIFYFTILITELFFNLNSSIYSTPFLSDLNFYNLLLNNGINKIHPLIIYLCWLSLLSYMSSSNNQKSKNYDNITQILLSVLLSFTGLFLGGWWAYQEGSWGGWWNWDPSEMFGLLILIMLALQLHLQKLVSSKSKIVLRNLTSILVIYYLFLQLNFSLLSHNFGIRQGDIIDFRYAYLFGLFCVAVSYNFRSNLYGLYAVYRPASRHLLTMLICFILLSFLFYITTSELWSDLLWRLLNIDLNNSSLSVTSLNLLLLVLLLVKYVRIEYHLIILIALSFTGYTTQITILLCILTTSFDYKKTHAFALVSLLLLSVYSSYSITISCGTKLEPSNNIVINLPLIHTTLESFRECYYTSYHSSLISNLSDTKAFYLLLNNHYSSQNYEISNSDITVCSNVIDFFNILAIAIVIAPYILFKKSAYDKLIIRI